MATAIRVAAVLFWIVGLANAEELPEPYLNEILSRYANDISCHVVYDIETENRIVAFAKTEGEDFLSATLDTKVGDNFLYSMDITGKGAEMGYHRKGGLLYINMGKVHFSRDRVETYQHGDQRLAVVSGTFTREILNKYAQAWDAFLIRTKGKGLDREGRFLFVFTRSGGVWMLKN